MTPKFFAVSVESTCMIARLHKRMNDALHIINYRVEVTNEAEMSH